MLYDGGKRYELESVAVMSTHVQLILPPLPHGLFFRLVRIVIATLTGTGEAPVLQAYYPIESFVRWVYQHIPPE